jgi:hypothetical protein
VSSESTVLGHVTASARFANFSLSLSLSAPVAPVAPSRLGADVSRTPTVAGQRHKSVPLNTCQYTRPSRATLCLGPHVARLALAVYCTGELEPVPYVPYPVLFESLPRT